MRDEGQGGFAPSQREGRDEGEAARCWSPEREEARQGQGGTLSEAACGEQGMGESGSSEEGLGLCVCVCAR